METKKSSESQLDYGKDLFEAPWFKEAFPDFATHQMHGAKILIDRVLSRSGYDSDMPYVDHIIYYGCGDGSVLKHLVQLWKKNDLTVNRPLKVTAFDASSKCVEKTQRAIENRIHVTVCASITGAFETIPEKEWKHAAVLFLGHTWFHLEQSEVLQVLRNKRPALLLIDIHQKWDHALNNLPYTEGYSSSIKGSSDECGEKKYSLRTDNTATGEVRRSIFQDDKEVFQTLQAKITTEDLLGISKTAESATKETLSEILRSARLSGTLTGGCDYVCRRRVPHDSGWGPMDCYCLVPEDRVASLLNTAYADILESLLHETTLKNSKKPAYARGGEKSGISALLKMFDEPDLAVAENSDVSGCRIAVGILPFDINLTFCKFFPLFENLSNEISEFLLLAENPSRFQQRYPSAYGVYQTLLSRSSCPQAFTLHWATDYVHTNVDRAFEKIEEEAIGISAMKEIQSAKRIELINVKNPPSFFMVPIYFGSLPLFTVALRFPAFFDPSRTGFDVFLATLSSLHDSVKVLLNPDCIRRHLIRPWIEKCIQSDWSKISTKVTNVEEKIEYLEEYLFGVPLKTDSGPKGTLSYKIGNKTYTGGVLSREWKSWILGLPSFHINKMAKVIEENQLLWQIWKKEKEVAKFDASLRISLWFQDGEFFEDGRDGESAHDSFNCTVHLKRLKRMFLLLGYNKNSESCQDHSWLPLAIAWLKTEAEKSGSSVKNFFGSHVDHFLFWWMREQLSQISEKVNCDTDKASQEVTKGPFKALKCVFCKSLANKGPKVRFGLDRIYHVLDAARCVGDTKVGIIAPATIDEITFAWPTGFESKFWSDEDPTLLLGEFVHSLAKMNDLLATVELVGDSATPGTAHVKLSLAFKLKSNMGGQDADKVECLRDDLNKLGVTVTELYGEKEISASFAMNKNGELSK